MARFILLVVALAVSFAVQVRAETLSGTLVDVSINVGDATGTARLFEPQDIRPEVEGGTYDATRNYRYAHLEKGWPYSISVEPQPFLPGRFGVGIAVDGRCILTGKQLPGNVQNAKNWPNMYVISRTSDNEFRGWREDADNIRRFVVTDARRSLAAELWNDQSATGTIVIAIFREDTPSILKGGSARGEKSIDLGTGAGEREESRVVGVDFIPRQTAYEIFVIRYASKAELKKLGVWEEPTPAPKPNRFWAQPNPYIGRLPE